MQRHDQRCGEVGHTKAPLLLLLLSTSLREKPAEQTYIDQSIYGWTIATAQEEAPNMQGDGRGKLVLKGAP